MSEPPITLGYALHELPRGRFGFRRWRWELWHGPLLVASGWRTAPAAAERALVTAASRRVHQVLGLRALHPHHARPLDRFTGGAVRVDCGPALCRLALRGEDAAAGGAAAA